MRYKPLNKFALSLAVSISLVSFVAMSLDSIIQSLYYDIYNHDLDYNIGTGQ